MRAEVSQWRAANGQRGLEITVFPVHFSSTLSPFAHPSRPFDCLTSTPLPLSHPLLRLDSVDHSGSLGPWLFLVCSPLLAHQGFFSRFIASTQSVIPAHSVLGCLLSHLDFHLLLGFSSPCLDSVDHSSPLGC